MTASGGDDGLLTADRAGSLHGKVSSPMFTGIVARRHRVASWTPLPEGGRRLVLETDPETTVDGDDRRWELEAGESIAVSGVCLTVIPPADALAFDVIPETLDASTLGTVPVGGAVNLERAVRVGDRLGGHYVTGHVDAVGRVVGRDDAPGETRLTIEVVHDRGFRTIPKGSVTIEGVSLTVVESEQTPPFTFSVALIPHTLEVTNLGAKAVGDPVNLEMDTIGKWVWHLLPEGMAPR